MIENQNGKFRHRRVNFAPVSNSALQDSRLSLKAKGMYALIQSLNSKPNYDLYKWSLINLCKEGEKAFDAAWKELKEAGYLKIYRIPSGENDKFKYEYELLDEADDSTPALINLNKRREVILPKAKPTDDKNTTEIEDWHTPQNGVYANSEPNNNQDINSHTPHFAPIADGTPCEAHPMPNGGNRRNTELRNTKSISQSYSEGQTDEIREKLKAQIEYDYFEENYPQDITGVDAIVDCMVDMISRPNTKINGVDQSQKALRHYISLADSCTVREFLEHMRSKRTNNIKNINAYWQTALINFLREQEVLKLQV